MKHLVCAIDLGASNYRVGFIEIGYSSRKIVCLEKGKVIKDEKDKFPDAKKTFFLICETIKNSIKKLEKENYKILKFIGLATPGEYDKDDKIIKDTVPNFPSLEKVVPKKFFKENLGNDWKIYCNNDSYTQGIYTTMKFFSHHFNNNENIPKKAILLAPGTGFGSCFLNIKSKSEVEPITSLYDIIINEKTNETSDDLMSGNYYDKTKAEKKIENFEDFYEKDSIKNLKNFLDKVIFKGTSKKKFSKDFNCKQFQDTNLIFLSGFYGNKQTKEAILPELKKEFPNLRFIQFDDINTVECSSYLIPADLLELSISNLIMDYKSVSDFIKENILNIGGGKKNIFIDGFIGINFGCIIKNIENEKDIKIFDFRNYFISQDKIVEMVKKNLGKKEEKTFAQLYTEGAISNFFDKPKIEKEIIPDLNNSEQKVIVFGSGCSYFAKENDVVIYRDITREEIGKRVKKGLVKPLGTSPSSEEGVVKDEKRPSYLSSKRFHYVDFYLLDKFKESLISKNKINFYIDENNENKIIFLNFKFLNKLIENYISNPFNLKSYYDEGVWGGHWLTKTRDLSKHKHLIHNCAWAYEIMCYMMAIKFKIPNSVNIEIEIPFKNVLDKFGEKIVGKKYYSFFNNYFPTRVNYDDCFKGEKNGMAIQIHPDNKYITTNFKEPLHQDESYYIIDADKDAFVYLGLKEGVKIEDFRKKCELAEKQNIPFNHKDYVNVIPAKKHDLFLIPAGTVHASGSGCVVLEISATTDRYTFHFYDYLRKDLHDRLRGIHLDHSFKMLQKYPFRKTEFVNNNLIQKPTLLREGSDWKEFVVGKLSYIVFQINRIEFKSEVSLDTNDDESYHILSLVEGEEVEIEIEKTKKRFLLKYSFSFIIPHSIGKYKILKNKKYDSEKIFMVLKTLPNLANYEDAHSK